MISFSRMTSRSRKSPRTNSPPSLPPPRPANNQHSNAPTLDSPAIWPPPHCQHSSLPPNDRLRSSLIRAWKAAHTLVVRIDTRYVASHKHGPQVPERLRSFCKYFLTNTVSLYQRTHTEMEGDHHQSPTWNPYHRSSTAESRSSQSHPRMSGLHLPPLRPQRFVGDGLDSRRPASITTTSSSSQAYIDLTADDAGPSAPPEPVQAFSNRASRPPRYNREIIDIEEDTQPPIHIPDSPEVEFISARTIDPPRQPSQPRLYSDIDLTDEDFEIYGVRPLEGGGGGVNMASPAIRFAMEDIFRGAGFSHLRRVIQRVQGPGARRDIVGVEVQPRAGRHRTNVRSGFNAPNLDFEIVGFDLGQQRQRTVTPTYEAPQAAPEGFTRSPAEDDVLVCPNCGDELCVGDTDLKKQVWILKGCGHVGFSRCFIEAKQELTPLQVYCGDCTENRALKAKKKKEKGAVRSAPFKTCVVEGCDKKCAARGAMIQIFL